MVRDETPPNLAYIDRETTSRGVSIALFLQLVRVASGGSTQYGVSGFRFQVEFL